MGEIVQFKRERVKVLPITLAPVDEQGDTPRIRELRSRLLEKQAATGFIPDNLTTPQNVSTISTWRKNH